MKISVIIPTYHREESLLNTLHSFQRQTMKDFEIIVVDNDAKSLLWKKINSFNKKAKNKVSYIKEPNLGVHNARHAGAKKSRGELLLFTDDDANFSPNWVEAYYEAFKKNPKMAAAAGPVLADWINTPPKWLREFIGKSSTFSVLSLMEISNKFFMSTKNFFYSVNMGIRRKILFQMGGFNPELVGDVYIGNGESGLNRELWQKEMLIGYIPEAIVYHRIPPERMTVTYFKHRMANEGAGGIYERYHKYIPSRFWLILEVFKLLIFSIGWFGGGLLLDNRTDKYSLIFQMESARIRSQIKYILRLIVDKNFQRFVLKANWL